jgi:hypothetical protein
MSDMAQMREICQQELRSMDGDLYLAHLFAREVVRDQFLACCLIYCHLRRIERETSEPMVQMIRLQWWLDQIDEAGAFQSGGGPVVDFASSCGLGGRPLVNLIERLMARCEADSEVPVNEIGERFFALLAATISPLPAPTVVQQAGAIWESWRSYGQLNHAATTEQYGEALAVKHAINALPRKTRRAFAPIFLAYGMSCRHMHQAPQRGTTFGYLMYLISRSITLKI